MEFNSFTVIVTLTIVSLLPIWKIMYVINYEYCQREKICSIGSGAVESGIKQISQRIKLTGAQWKKEDVNKILQLRCAYLNGKFALLA